MKDQEKMLQYVSEVLSHYRTKKESKTPYAPFTEDALRGLMANLQRRTPRDMNKRCHNALMKAFEKGIFEAGKDSEITLEFVQEMKSGGIG